MENKDWREQFNEKFVKQGIPIGIAKYEAKDGLDITPSKIISFIDSLLKSKQEEIERAIGLKYKLFGAAGCSRDEEINRINAVHIARMDGYNQAIVELKLIISNLLK